MSPQYKPGDEVVYKPVGGTVSFLPRPYGSRAQ
jgi:hypothetical protein